MNRYSSNPAACKRWSACFSVIILLVGGLTGLPPAKMLWAAGPLLLLGLVEAGYAAQERQYADLLKAKRGNDETALPLPESAIATVVQTAFAALSLSIWPFYLGLFALVAIGGERMAASNQTPPIPAYSPHYSPSAGLAHSEVTNASGVTAPNGSRPNPRTYPMPQSQIQGSYPQQMPPYPQQSQMQPQQFPQSPQMPQRLPNGSNGTSTTGRPPVFPTNPSAVRAIPAQIPLHAPATANATDPSSNSAPSQPPQTVATPSPQHTIPVPATPVPAFIPSTPSAAKKKG